MIEKINFTYNKKEGRSCWDRYNTFIAEHKTVWGRSPNIKQIIELHSMDFDMDVKEISEAYENIFNVPRFTVAGYIVTTPFSMINDNEEFDQNHSKLFYSIYNLFGYPPSIVVGHELFHIYFEKYTKRNIPDYETSKEYFTVIMNDIFGKDVSKGYPEHQEMRAKILEIWHKSGSLNETIKASLGKSA